MVAALRLVCKQLSTAAGLQAAGQATKTLLHLPCGVAILLRVRGRVKAWKMGYWKTLKAVRELNMSKWYHGIPIGWVPSMTSQRPAVVLAPLGTECTQGTNDSLCVGCEGVALTG